MSEIAIDVDHVTKVFRRSTAPPKTLMERALSIGRHHVETFYALDDVHFTVSQGETVGILGHNGSGKSTMLKCIAGTIRPTEGVIRVRGALSALLELGAGFHPELTGRENVYLNGSILGFSKARIDEIFDDIVDFAEIRDFIDSQVKQYSSGMFARLGFAVAVNLKPDVLLIDEVLAVGDEAFQRKCLERVRLFQEEGRTILLVTHAPELVRQICDAAVVLDSGKMLHFGDPGDGVSIYRAALDRRSGIVQDIIDPTPGGLAMQSPLKLTSVALDPSHGRNGAFSPGEALTIRVRIQASEPVAAARARFILYSHDGVLMANLSTFDVAGHDVLNIAAGVSELVYTIDELPLMDGLYQISILLQDPHETLEYDRLDSVATFTVISGGPGTGRVAFKIGFEHQSVGFTEDVAI